MSFLAVCFLMVAVAAQAQDTQTHAVLFKNVRIFDGTSDQLSPPSNVLVVGNIIQTISDNPIDPPDHLKLVTIEGKGRTLMPGMIDAHWHTMMAALPKSSMPASVGYVNIVAAQQATATLMRGFTTIRDMGGPVFGIKRAIDEGIIAGPRIFPSGAGITQTGGHFDFRMPYQVPAPPDAFFHQEKINMGVIVNGVPEMLQAVREQLMLGASQIKLLLSGGYSSVYDAINVVEFTQSEVHAAVLAAENWNTYVAAHAYTSEAVQHAIRAGVKVIEHGQLIDAETAKMMAKHDIWWSLQPFVEKFAVPLPTEAQRAKQQLVFSGTDNAYRLAQKYDIKTAWGTDILFAPDLVDTQGNQVAYMTRWYSPAEVLQMVTATNAKLVALGRSSYPDFPEHPLGVVEEGALADLLLVDGNPLKNIDLLAKPHENLVVIMKNGVIYKNTLD